MTRPLSDIPTAELPALVEQGLPVSEYAAEIQRRREPDCVFNVWSDNLVSDGSFWPANDLLAIKDRLRRNNQGEWVTHRIRVFLKGAA